MHRLRAYRRERKALEHRAHATNLIAHPDRAELIEIGRLIDDGKVHPHVSAVYGLKHARSAQERVERGHSQGEVVLQLG